MIRHIDDHGKAYDSLAFICPGCFEMMDGAGLHMLPVNTTEKSPAWTWDGSLEFPTLTPSILTRIGDKVCHSYLTAGKLIYLDDCNHSLAGKHVRLPNLPIWFTKEASNGQG